MFNQNQTNLLQLYQFKRRKSKWILKRKFQFYCNSLKTVKFKQTTHLLVSCLDMLMTSQIQKSSNFQCSIKNWKKKWNCWKVHLISVTLGNIMILIDLLKCCTRNLTLFQNGNSNQNGHKFWLKIGHSLLCMYKLKNRI